MFPEDTQRSQEFYELLIENGFTKDEIGIAIIDLKEPKVKIFGYNIDHFVYPASIYKIFIGAEVLRRIEIGSFSLDQKVIVASTKKLNASARLFPRNRTQLLTINDSVTIDYLLGLMLAYSDNDATNILIDLVGCENITQNIIYPYHWNGSVITKEFLDASIKGTTIPYSKTTKVSPRHVAEFFYLVEKEKLISPFVSQKLKSYLLRWNSQISKDLSVLEFISYHLKGGHLENSLYLPEYEEYYKKAGFALDYSLTGIIRLLRSFFTKGWLCTRWVNDAGVVQTKDANYVIAVFSANKHINPYKKFPMEEIARLVLGFMER